MTAAPLFRCVDPSLKIELERDLGFFTDFSFATGDRPYRAQITHALPRALTGAMRHIVAVRHVLTAPELDLCTRTGEQAGRDSFCCWVVLGNTKG